MTRNAETRGRYCIGVDTGGTFTDAVVLDRAGQGGAGTVLGHAKARTTHDRLDRGVECAIRAAMAAAEIPPERIELVSLSTTLATNALAEGHTGDTALVMLGFDRHAVRRSGISEFGDVPRVLQVRGGHDAGGEERNPLDLAALSDGIRELQPSVDAFAVAGMFAVRNPSHEREARALIRRLTGLPVTCSHELTAELDGPRRALTTYLNAGLIPRIDALMRACEEVLAGAGIDAPVMAVRGDGTLMNLPTAREFPVHTVLSGPAASATGAHFLSGCADAVVSDIGGTTTDVAVLEGGAVRIDPQGSLVRGRRTFVRAVDMRTFALGGDSEVAVTEDAAMPRLSLGPRRAVPIVEFYRQYPDLVLQSLRRQLEAGRPDPTHARFAEISRAGRSAAPDSPAARNVLRALADGPLPVDALVRERRWIATLERLRDRGFARIAAFTPTDAFEMLNGGDPSGAAELAASLLARQRDRRGREAADGPEALAGMVLARLRRESSLAVLASAMDHDGFEGRSLAASPLAEASLDGRAGLVRAEVRLSAPLIAVGASARAHYPGVAKELGAELVCPPLAEVANAVGAAVGGVVASAEILVLQPTPGVFAVHGEGPPERFPSLPLAVEAATERSRRLASRRAAEAGAVGISVGIRERRRMANVEGEALLVELRVRATARGLPGTRTGKPDRLVEPRDSQASPKDASGEPDTG